MPQEERPPVVERRLKSGAVVISEKQLAMMFALRDREGMSAESIKAFATAALPYSHALKLDASYSTLLKVTRQIPQVFVKRRRLGGRIEVKLTRRGVRLLSGKEPLHIHGGTGWTRFFEAEGWRPARRLPNGREYTNPKRKGVLRVLTSDIEIPAGGLSTIIHATELAHAGPRGAGRSSTRAYGSDPAKIPGIVTAAFGRQTMDILDAGKYAVERKIVDIRADVDRAVKGTVPYEMGFVPSWDRQIRPTTIMVKNVTLLAAAKTLMARGRRPLVVSCSTGDPKIFLHGLNTDDAYLAWSSTLVACLEGREFFYLLRLASDTDHMIYSPDVPVIRSDDGRLLRQPFKVSVLTTSSPYVGEHRADEVVYRGYRRRIAKMLAIGLAEGHDSIVFGAWGCGEYFGGDANEIAGVFREALRGEFRSTYGDVVFAIRDKELRDRFRQAMEEAPR